MAGLIKYSLVWPEGTDLAQVEVGMIRRGGRWEDPKTKRIFGNGLFFHYKELQKLLWPQEEHHRWTDLILDTILKHTIIPILGPKDSGKTRTCSKFALADYFCFPECTLTLISSTDLRGLEMRVWGDLKMLWQQAHDRYDWIPGNVLESKHAIATDDLDEDSVRDMRKGIMCIPCMSSSGQFIGLSKYVGIKQKRRRLIGDEVQFMKDGFLESIANLNSGDFKGVFLGNPIGQDDPLDKVSEPKDGWTSLPEPEKTVTWPNRWLNGVTINLVGTDSPNFDQSQDPRAKYPWMINKHSIAAVEEFYGKESLQWFSQCKGIRRSGINARRVITRELCEQFHAFDPPIWEGMANRHKIAATDIAYGGVGGDRCIGGHIEFGPNSDGDIILAVYPPVVVPVSAKKFERPEDQIAAFMRDYCKSHDIPPEDYFYDSTGRGTMGTSFARLWSAEVQPVEFGGKATDRPVSLDLYIQDPDTKERRLKLCHEHYSKFVTELWFAVRYCVESDQLRGLPVEVAKEGYMREWMEVRGNKIELESKADTKKRMGRSPDYFDWLVTAIEGARRRGFFIKRIGGSKNESDPAPDWFADEAEKQKSIIKGALLEHAT